MDKFARTPPAPKAAPKGAPKREGVGPLAHPFDELDTYRRIGGTLAALANDPEAALTMHYMSGMIAGFGALRDAAAKDVDGITAQVMADYTNLCIRLAGEAALALATSTTTPPRR